MSTKSDTRQSRTIRVKTLARVEGEGALYVQVRHGEVQHARLDIFEPPRLFEAMLRGRHFTEAPDLTARICGICPVAYQMSAAQALETLCGVTVDGPLRDLRHLLYCGEWIESHALHIYLLHAPDFLGYQDAIGMAQNHPEAVRRGLRLKQIGNEIMRLLGGREIHPISVRVGGFYRVPTRQELETLVEPLTWARKAALETLHWVAGFDMPDFEQDAVFVALRHPEEYAILDGRLVSSEGLDVPIEAFPDHFREEQVTHSTALHATMDGHGPYLVGPLARYSLNFDRLAPAARAAAREAGLAPVCRNPFQSILVRSVELVHACDTALRLVERYHPPAAPFVEVTPRAGTGVGCTEAPRGFCWHRYTLDDDGLIQDARIVPPTSQNQKAIESDLRRFVATRLDLPDEVLQWQCEQVIRNYDPCISCACHYLRLHMDRS